jgi:UDP-2-acetamido-3-amino-2,3-dideoxy-glucuronate N-acetyltransferase
MVNIAVIGCGYWGKNLVRNFHELGNLNIICDKDPALLSSFKEKYPEIKTTTEHQEVLNSKDIKAVAIATPAVTHYQLAKKVILAGKDVFVEKPLSITTKQARELVDLAKANNKILMVGHILQYHPAVGKLKELIDAGNLGKIQYIYSNRLNIGKLRTEENILWSFAPHDISVMLMLIGEEPKTINAFGGKYITEGVFDTTLTEMEFSNNIKGHIFVSWIHPFKEQKLIIVGTKAMAVFDDVSKEKLFLYPHKIEYKGGKLPVAQKAEHYTVDFDKKEPLKEELRHFIDCVEKRKTPKTDGEEGSRVLKVLEKAEKSLGFSANLNYSSVSQKDYFAHKSSVIDEGVKVGKGTKIWHFSHILKDSSIGKNCRIGQNVVIGPKAVIGNGCKIQNNVCLYEGITLEDQVFCGPSCVFTNVFNPRSHIPRMNELKETTIKKGATIGANATIICGHVLGSYCFIGAGAVVTKDIPDYALVYGNPAKIQGWICECGINLEFKKDKAVCKECGLKYKKINDKKVEKIS